MLLKDFSSAGRVIRSFGLLVLAFLTMFPGSVVAQGADKKAYWCLAFRGKVSGEPVSYYSDAFTGNTDPGKYMSAWRAYIHTIDSDAMGEYCYFPAVNSESESEATRDRDADAARKKAAGDRIVMTRWTD
jgi:hypothetical protein